jgi:hypothetical protein
LFLFSLCGARLQQLTGHTRKRANEVSRAGITKNAIRMTDRTFPSTTAHAFYPNFEQRNMRMQQSACPPEINISSSF